ncbi:hypothetical protein F5X99DRAFT_380459 [Biscogniauxia marginata]|nr:hypothetical protein F5X99DRAFT_380459 [Biscogniauxia marginata]
MTTGRIFWSLFVSTMICFQQICKPMSQFVLSLGSPLVRFQIPIIGAVWPTSYIGHLSYVVILRVYGQRGAG